MAYEISAKEACPRDGTRIEDWFDDEGIPHDPPRVEAKVHVCEGCARAKQLEINLREQAKADVGTGEGAQIAAERALAGVSVIIAPFDPTSDDD